MRSSWKMALAWDMVFSASAQTCTLRRAWLHAMAKALRGSTRRHKTPGSPGFQPCVEGLESRTTPTVLDLTPVADNTLYQVSVADPSQQLSNGTGQHFYVGETGQSSIRRGAIKFDLSTVPAGSTINSVTLALHMSRTRNGAQNVALHRVLMDWGEGTSNAALAGRGGEGGGIQAMPGDLTWFYSSFSTQKWTAPGGDFVPAAALRPPST